MAVPEMLVSQRMKNLHFLAIGWAGFDAITGLAAGSNPENLDCVTADAAGNLITPQGVLGSTKRNTDIDLSDLDVCAEAGMSIPAGQNIYIFVIQNGTIVKARVGASRKKITRASVNAALVSSTVHDVLPLDVDMSEWICTGYCKLVNVTNPFIIGTTSTAAAGVTDTYVELTRMMAGANIEG
jgi:hypothetical protein